LKHEDELLHWTLEANWTQDDLVEVKPQHHTAADDGESSMGNTAMRVQMGSESSAVANVMRSQQHLVDTVVEAVFGG